MRKSTIAFMAILSAIFTFPASAEGLTKVRFVHEWRFEGHLAPYFVALDKGYYRQEGLDVTIDPGTGSIDGINLVASGTYEMGQADISALIKYRGTEGAAPIKAVMMAYNVPAFAILTLKKNHIQKLKDLEGRILGAPAADGSYAHWPIIVKLNHIDTSKVTIKNVGFAIREAMLAKGDVDAVTAFSSNSLGLKAMGIPDEQIVVLPMRDFGLELYGSAIMAHPDFMREHPEAVAGFVRATIKGFLSTFENPEAAIDILMKYNPIGKRDIELERLKLIINCCYLTGDVRENGFGGVDMKRLQKSIEQLAIYHDFTYLPKAEEIFTSKFLPPKKQRIP